MTYLTERQRDVLRFIEVHVSAEGVAPTLQEISDAFGFRSTASAQKHVAQLENKGFLARHKHQKRGLVLVDRESPPPQMAAELPLYGVVAAGSPIESLPDDEQILVPPDLLRGGDHYVLRVRGDSMIGDGIHDGDLVIVQRSQGAAEGDMVVALVAGEVTLKRIFREAGRRVRLQPSNPELQALTAAASDVDVQGVVVGLLRRY